MSRVWYGSIAGYEVVCKEKSYDRFGDKPIEVIVGGNRDNLCSSPLVNAIINLVRSTYRGEHLLKQNVVSFHDVVPPHQLEYMDKDAVSIAGVSAILEELAVEFPIKIPIHQLKEKLKGYERCKGIHMRQ